MLLLPLGSFCEEMDVEYASVADLFTTSYVFSKSCCSFLLLYLINRITSAISKRTTTTPTAVKVPATFPAESQKPE